MSKARTAVSMISYACVRCHKQHTAPRDSALALLALCSACQATRYAAGLKAQRESERK